jgi:hypothetical protein
MSTKNGWKVSMAGWRSPCTPQFILTSVLGTYVEGGPPTYIADLISLSFPNLLRAETGKRTAQAIAALDKWDFFAILS